jgi:hypothetical protein
MSRVIYLRGVLLRSDTLRGMGTVRYRTPKSERSVWEWICDHLGSLNLSG